MERTELTIEGMSCEHCTRAVSNALRSVEGVEVEQVEIGSARIAFEPGQVSREQVQGVVEEEGFTLRDAGKLR